MSLARGLFSRGNSTEEIYIDVFFNSLKSLSLSHALQWEGETGHMERRETRVRKGGGRSNNIANSESYKRTTYSQFASLNKWFV